MYWRRIAGTTLLSIVSLAWSINCLHAEQLPTGCYAIEDLFKTKLSTFGGTDWIAQQHKRGGGVWYLLFTQKIKDNTSSQRKWVLATRHSENRPEIYCVEGTGSRVVVLASLHNSRFSDKYGMPGSNNPRCGDAHDPLEGLKVRGWASRELGESLILSLEEPLQSGRTFIILMSKVDDNWIFLSQKAGGATCYFARGKSFDVRELRLR